MEFSIFHSETFHFIQPSIRVREGHSILVLAKITRLEKGFICEVMVGNEEIDSRFYRNPQFKLGCRRDFDKVDFWVVCARIKDEGRAGRGEKAELGADKQVRH